MAEIRRIMFLVGAVFSLGACSEEPILPPQSHASYSTNPAIVRKVQLALRNRGYYAGVIDGFLGQNTAIGIQRFQVDHCQIVTPLVDRSLLVSLGIASKYSTAHHYRADE
jgi:hypothetical protein